MPSVNIDEIITEGHVRFFLQYGAEVGAAPGNELLYAGTDTQYLRIGEAAHPIRGSITPINVPDPNRLKRFRRVGKTEEPPDLPTFPITFLQKHGAIPRQLYNLGDCPVTFYRLAGFCKDLSDFEKGWSDYVYIYANAIATERTAAGVGAFDSDDALEDEVTFVADDIYPVGRMAFDTELDEATYVSVTSIDAAYGTPNSCSACREGTEHIYVLGSNGTSHNVYYSLDAGATWNVLNLATSANITPTAIAVAGNYLIATFGESAAAGGYFLMSIDPDTGAPGTAAKITNGVTSGEVVNDLWVLSPRSVFFAADDGKIYKSSNLANGVVTVESSGAGTDYVTIDGVQQSGVGSVIVAGGTAQMVYSLDDGVNWTSITGATAGAVVSLAVLSDRRIWAAGDALEFTADLGQTWETINLPTPYAGAITAYIGVVFATDEVGYAIVQTDDIPVPTQLYATINGGRSWSIGESRFYSDVALDFGAGGKMAVPMSDNVAVNANNLLVPAGADGTFIFSAAVR